MIGRQVECSITFGFLLKCFPARDAHFLIGEEDEKKTEDDDEMTPDPK